MRASKVPQGRVMLIFSFAFETASNYLLLSIRKSNFFYFLQFLPGKFFQTVSKTYFGG